MNIKMETFLVKIVSFFLSKLDILLQWEPENYGIERQHYSVFDIKNIPNYSYFISTKVKNSIIPEKLKKGKN